MGISGPAQRAVEVGRATIQTYGTRNAVGLARIQIPDIFGAQHFQIPVRRTRIFLPMDGSATDIVCRADERRHILAFPRWRGIFLQMEQQKLSDTRIQIYPHKNSVYSIQGQRKTGARQNLHNIEGPLRLCLRQRGVEIARSAVGQEIVFQNKGNPHYGNRTACGHSGIQFAFRKIRRT